MAAMDRPLSVLVACAIPFVRAADEFVALAELEAGADNETLVDVASGVGAINDRLSSKLGAGLDSPRLLAMLSVSELDEDKVDATSVV
jgi:hypothetical protein